jgi:membrane fusion protein, multidrug efflux system
MGMFRTVLPRQSSGLKPTTPEWRLALSLVATLTMPAILVGAGCNRVEPAASLPPEVLVTPVIQKDVPIYTESLGTAVGFVNAQVMPRVQGHLLKQDYQDGAHLRAGDLLFEIDDRPYKAALDHALGDLAEQRANLRKHQLDVARYTPLAAEGAISKQELDDAVQATHASDAQVQAAEAAVETARLNLGWTKIYSPIDGIAGIAPAQVGDLVTPSSVLTTVSQIDPMKVNFSITERDYLRFADKFKKYQEKVRATDAPDLQLILADGSTYPVPGEFYVVNRQIDQQTGTIQVQAIFSNPDGLLRPGLYAKVRAPSVIVRGAVLVPARAVNETQGVQQVAVVGADDRVALRTVKVGAQVDGLWIIDEGLNPGERVVTNGLQKVRDGIPVRPKPDVPTITTARRE